MERQDLERMGNRRVHFLPRRCYENYLFDFDAIAALMNTLDSFKAQSIDTSAISSWFERHASPPEGVSREEWLVTMDGAKVMGRLFSELSNQQERYHKIIHGEILTAYILESRPEALSDLSALLTKALSNQPISA